MSHTLTNSLAAVFAVVLAITSIGAIVTVPPAQAQNASGALTVSELA